MLKKAYQAYYKQKYMCREKKDAQGNPVEMRLSFMDWLGIWFESGKWEQRGIKAGTYCMARHNDIGHYEEGNVSIILNADNISQAHKGRKHTEEHRRRNAEARIGVPRSEETKVKIGNSHRGTKRTEETKRKMRDAQLGKVHSEATKRKLSEANKGKPMKRVKCVRCGLETSPQNLSRHQRTCK